MIILDELPFKTVEHEGFRDFVNMLQPQFQIPSRATITRDCMDLFVVFDKVLTVTVDNASSNDTCLRYLKRRLKTWKKSVLESQNLHMRCCAHILSLVVKEGLKEVDDSVIRIRWNSTYLMLQSAIKFQAAFDMLEEQDTKYRSELFSSKGMPTEEDWDYARCLLPFLRGFYTATLRISGSLYVTSNSYFDEVFGVRAMIKKKMLVEDESWWKQNEARFPVIAAMARDILAIPASTVASESAFSTGGRVLDAFRSSLTPTLVEALICSQNWLRSKSVPFNIEEKLDDLVRFEAEMKDLPQAMSTLTVDD
ncbi:zinc finger BED domain-containing protein RICESLEEPER 2-like protein [Tanacetum coccineum]